MLKLEILQKNLYCGKRIFKIVNMTALNYFILLSLKINNASKNLIAIMNERLTRLTVKYRNKLHPSKLISPKNDEY